MTGQTYEMQSEENQFQDTMVVNKVLHEKDSWNMYLAGMEIVLGYFYAKWIFFSLLPFHTIFSAVNVKKREWYSK